MEIVEAEFTLVTLINDYGFPIIMALGMGYFIYFIWTFINEKLDPAIEEMHTALIRVIDKTRMLDQDLIRLKEKTNVMLRYKQKIERENGKEDFEGREDL
jgi:hypothetical protein|tara:strand:+ start:151 stop:450 length:300 start_codon:yes stop_codon:yes gene_type:complete